MRAKGSIYKVPVLYVYTSNNYELNASLVLQVELNG